MKKTISMLAMTILAGGLAFAQSTTTTTTTTGTTPTTPPAKKNMSIEARQERQQKRIAEGIEKGQLTPKEAEHLEKRESNIEAREQKMRASGGKFTKGERKAIQHQLNGSSKAIKRQRHDKQRVGK